MAANKTAPAADPVAEVAAKINDALDAGYVGVAPGASANAAHSLLTGPHAPALQPDDRTRAYQPSQEGPS